MKKLLAEKGLRVSQSEQALRRPSHWRLVNIYRTNGEEIGKKLLDEGFARTWSRKRRNDWCG
jgi:hypothetical protein